ncbi:DUF4347 domain-containing protein [Candidatus Woesearchaeota archaeon]|nr:DUF4347 domain-containing protein [Candidatus Woesearchaeota archaeon]
MNKKLKIFSLAALTLVTSLIGPNQPTSLKSQMQPLVSQEKSANPQLAPAPNPKDKKDLETQLLALTTEEGKPAFNYEQVDKLITLGGTPEYASELLKLKDKRGDSVRFNSNLILQYKEVSGTVEYAKDLVQLTDRLGHSFFDGDDIYQFHKVGGTVEYAKMLLELKDKSSWPIFGNGSTIATFKKLGGTVEEAKQFLKIKDTKGNSVFWGWCIVKFKEVGGTVEEAEDLALIKDKVGDPLIYGCEMADLKIEGISYEDIKEYSSIKDKNGNLMFDVNDFIAFKEGTLNFEYAKELADLDFNSASIRMFQKIGLEIKEVTNFEDSAKPNAVIILPSNDWNNAFANDPSIAFYKDLLKNYDTWVRVAETDQEVYQSLQTIPNIELLILSGHGEKKALHIGYGNEEENYIDTSDKELKGYLKNLSKDATIFLNACSTGAGRRKADNLANFVARITKNNEVISSTKSFSQNEMKIKSIYPLKFRIIDDRTKEDQTYIAK